MAVICAPDPGAPDLARAAGEAAVITATIPEMLQALGASPGEMLIVIGESVPDSEAMRFAAAFRAIRPAAGVILVRRNATPDLLAEAMRAGIREVVSGPAALGEACHRSRETTSRLRGPGRQGGQVITVFAAKGGCGKTTVAVNLAVCLARNLKLRTCLVDLDMAFGDVAVTLQATPAATIADAMPMAGHLDQAGTASLLTGYRPGLDLLLAPDRPGDSEKIGAALTGEILKCLAAIFDCVVIDTPAQFSDHVLTAMDASAAHILLAAPEIPALKNLRVTLDVMDQLGYPETARWVVLNRADSRVGLTAAESGKLAGCPLAARIPSSRAVPQSVNAGLPITVGRPSHPVSQAVARLATAMAHARRLP